MSEKSNIDKISYFEEHKEYINSLKGIDPEEVSLVFFVTFHGYAHPLVMENRHDEAQPVIDELEKLLPKITKTTNYKLERKAFYMLKATNLQLLKKFKESNNCFYKLLKEENNEESILSGYRFNLKNRVGNISRIINIVLLVLIVMLFLANNVFNVERNLFTTFAPLVFVILNELIRRLMYRRIDKLNFQEISRLQK